MPFSHHSHSGQFCNHAKNTLAEMVSTAVQQRMTVFALTEHVPRGDGDLYPGEVETSDIQRQVFENYMAEAQRLRGLVETDQRESLVSAEHKCTILIGLETEWIREPESHKIVQDLRSIHNLDFIVGSVHHVKTIPIDFDRTLYEGARTACGGTDRLLFLEYFDAQLAMLKAFRPEVIGHFDLIRLFSDNPNTDLRQWDDVWSKVERNLAFIKTFGGLLEINSAALRKGLAQPYPTREICQTWMRLGGDFVLSDDSHAIDQVCTCYDQALDFIKSLGVVRIAYLDKNDLGALVQRRMELDELAEHPFWISRQRQLRP